MDAVSGAASVITVVGLALSSVQTIHNAVYSLRNGSPTIEQMLFNLQSLSSILQQLSQSQDRFYRAADLPKFVQACATNLGGFEDQLVKMIPSAENKARKLLKSAKLIICSKDLDRMAGLIQQHVAALSLQLQIIEG